MIINNTAHESADSLIVDCKKVLQQNLLKIQTDDSFIYEHFRKTKPNLTDAITKYCEIYDEGKITSVADTGVLDEFSLASKNLIKTFRFTDYLLDKEFLSTNLMYRSDSPLLLSMETIFDVSLLREQGKMRRFRNIYNLARTIRQLSDDSYLFFVKPYFYYVNTATGEILRRCDKSIYDFEAERYLYINDLNEVHYKDIELYTLSRGLVGNWHPATYLKRSGNVASGVVYKYLTFSTKKTLADYGEHHFSIPAHHVVMLCKFGLNSTKFCMGSGSLLTVDHINGDAQDNRQSNLAMITRVANAKQAKASCQGINFIEFFEACGYGSSPSIH